MSIPALGILVALLVGDVPSVKNKNGIDMAIADPRIHMICGICGSNKYFEYEIVPRGNCNFDGEEYTAVVVVCNNCSSLTNLDEIVEEKEKT